ncbi:MAG: DNA cytosine methyltransferase [Armatimonadota bacterium]|nr:MAG: DNA cytosine methyltransferase [Armatimonadota bacterium]
MRPRLLDLFCGAGGAAMGYHRAGFEVYGVDIHPQPHYLESGATALIQSDALAYLRALIEWQPKIGEWDAIHASPPCQAYTRKAADWGRKRNHWTEHLDLLGPTRELLRATGLPYVIENVPGAPIDAQLELCGTHFGLRIIKHRLFEANWPLPMAPASCDHRDVYNPWSGKGRSADQLREAQGTPWIPMSGGASRKAGVTGDLFNAIPPAYTEHIGRALMAYLAAERAA